MLKIKKLFYVSIIKTLFFNLKYFGFKGLFFPCVVSRKTKLLKLEGRVFIKNPRFAKVLIGFGPEQATNGYGRFYNTGTIYFNEEAHLYDGFYIYNNGVLDFGKNFKLGSSKVFCEDNITIGDDVMISWDCLLMDSDLHDMYVDGKKVNFNKSIIIGNHVWICSYCHIYKGTVIPNNTIIASDSHISNVKLTNEKSIFGNFGKLISNNIEWVWEYTK